MLNKKAIAAFAAGATLLSGLAFAASAMAEDKVQFPQYNGAGMSGYAGDGVDQDSHGTVNKLGDTDQTDAPNTPVKDSDMHFGEATKHDPKGIQATDYPAYENPVYNEGYNEEYSKHAGVVEAKNNELVRLYNMKLEKLYDCDGANPFGYADVNACKADLEKEKQNFVNNRLPSLSVEDVFGPRDSVNRTVMKSHRPIDGEEAKADKKADKKAEAKAEVKAEAKKSAAASLPKTGAAVALAAVAASVLAGMGVALRKIRH